MSNKTYKNFDISKITVFDVAKKFPNNSLLIISQNEEMSDDESRVLSLWVYAEHYKILELQEILLNAYKATYPDVFELM